jgi:hypothetical protein
MAARHQQAEAREGAGGHRQRRRRRQRQRARAAHHQHRDEHPQSALRVDQVPGDAGGERQQQQGGDEPGGDAIGLLHQTRLLGQRPLHQAQDGGEPRGLADLLHAQHQRAADVDRTAGHSRCRRPWRRGGSRRSAAIRPPRSRPARHSRRQAGFPPAPPEPGPRQQREAATRSASREGYAFRSRRRGRHGAAKLLDGSHRLVARQHLQVAPAQQQEDEHRHRVEIHFAAPDASVAHRLAAKAAPTPSATGTSMPTRRRRRSRQALRKKGAAEYSTTGRVSARLAQRSRPRCRRHVALVRHVGRHGVHHHLHHAEAGDEQAPQRQRRSRSGDLLGAGGVVGIGAVADGGWRRGCRRALIRRSSQRTRARRVA